MIFAPFTGKDNHGRPVTFACGLLCNEDADSFSWLFNQFICCMGEEPKLIITDQDLGMKSAVKRVFSDTRHRLCMWHIMVKLSVKVPKGLLSDEKFKKELSKCVWSDMIEPDEFDEVWNDICCRYGLKDNVWINSLYADRHNWVPAYFRDFPMSGLLRTTSLSESENSFFKRYTRSTSNFIEFWMKFNHGLDAQRKITERLDYVDQNSSPTMRTSLAIEKNASMLFTSKIFDIVQEEIVCSLSSCRISQIISMDVKEEYVVNDQENGDFIVVFNQEDETYCCGCKLFGRKGFLCRHIFFLLKLKGVNHIPQRYVLSRWMKSSLCNKAENEKGYYNVGDAGMHESQRVSNKLLGTFFKLIQRMQGQTIKLSSFLETIESAGSVLCSNSCSLGSSNHANIMQEYYGSIPSSIEVSSPNVVKTKGSGSRLISRQEKAARVQDKPLRRCAKCGKMARHDSRNCDKVKMV